MGECANCNVTHCRKMRERRRKDIEHRVIRKLQRKEDEKKAEEEEVG